MAEINRFADIGTEVNRFADLGSVAVAPNILPLPSTGPPLVREGIVQPEPLIATEPEVNRFADVGEPKTQGPLPSDAEFFAALASADRKPKTTVEQIAGLAEEQDDLGFGFRRDGTPKGKGFLGILKLGGKLANTDAVATEFTTQSNAVKVNGKRIDFPSLVPTLSQDELDLMLNDIIPNSKNIPETIMRKAIDHANKRLVVGESVFASDPKPTPTTGFFSTADSPRSIEHPDFRIPSTGKEIGFIASLKEELATPLKAQQNLIPIVGDFLKAIESMPVRGAFGRLTGDWDYNKWVIRPHAGSRMTGFEKFPGRKASKQNDIRLVQEWIEKKIEQSEKEYTFGGQIAKGVIALPKYMGEFAITGGFASFGQKIGQKLLLRSLAGKVSQPVLRQAWRASGWTARALARSIGLAPNVIAGAIEKNMPNQVHFEGDKLIVDVAGDTPASALLKSWGEIVIESAGEETGEAILRALPFGKKFSKAVAKAWVGKFGGKVDDVVSKMIKKGGYSNIIGELGEEDVTRLMMATAGLQGFEGDLKERLGQALQQSIENKGIEAVVLTIPIGGRVVAGAAGKVIFGKGEAPVTPIEGETPAEPTITPPTAEVAPAVAQEQTRVDRAFDVAQKLANRAGKSVFVQGDKVFVRKPEGEFTEIKPTDKAVTTNLDFVRSQTPDADGFVTVEFPSTQLAKDAMDLVSKEAREAGLDFEVEAKDKKLRVKITPKALEAKVPTIAEKIEAQPKIGTKAFAEQKKELKEEVASKPKLKQQEFIDEKLSPDENPDDIVRPRLWIGNVTEGMKKRLSEALGKDKEQISDFLEGAFPTNRTPIPVTRRDAVIAHDQLKEAILDALEVKGHIYRKDVPGGKLVEIKNPVRLTETEAKSRGLKHIASFTGIRTNNDIALVQAFWGNIANIRDSLGLAKAASPIKVIRKGARLFVTPPTVKERIKAATQPASQFESGMTSLQVLNATMKKAEFVSNKAFLEGAREIVKTHKNLAKFAAEKLKGLDVTQAERNRLMGFVASNRTPLQKVHAIASIEMLAEKVEQRKALNELKSAIKETKTKIGKTMQDGGIRPEFANKLNTLIDSFSTTKISQWRIKDIGSLKAHLENIKEGISNNLDYDAEYRASLAESLIPASRMKHLDRLTKSSIHLLKPTDIRAITTEIQRLVHLSNTKNRLILQKRAREEGETLNSIMEEQKGVRNESRKLKTDRFGESIQKAGIARSFWRHVAGMKNYDVKTLVMAIEGGDEATVAKVLNDFFRKGRNEKWLHVQTIADLIDKRLAEKGVTNRDLALYSPNFQRIFRGERGQHIRGLFGVKAKLHRVKVAGKVRAFTMDELASFFMHGESEFNRTAMFNEGVADPHRKLGKLTPEELGNITRIVQADKTAKAMTDIFTEIAETINKDAINKVSRNLKGIDIADVVNYYTVERLKKGGVAGNQQYRISLLETESFLRERTGSKNPIVIRPLSTVLGATIEGVSEYVGMAEPLRQAKNILNYRPWQTVVDNKGHESQRKLVDELIKRVEDKGSVGEEQNIAGGILRNIPRAILVEPGIFLGQLFSEVLYANTDIPTKYLVGNPVPSNAEAQRMMKNFPWAWGRRHIGSASIEARDITKSDAMLRLFTGKQSFKNLAISPLSTIDIKAITYGWLATEKWVKNTTSLAPNTKEFYAEVNKRAHKAISESQPMFETENRSVLTSSRSPLFRSLVMFRSFIDQPLRQASRARIKLRNGKIKRVKFNLILGVIMAQFAAYTLMRALVDFLIFRKKRSPYQILKDVALSPLRALNFIGFAAQRQADRLIDIVRGEETKTRFRKSELEGLVGKFVNETADSVKDFTDGVAFMGTDETVQSGKNKGRLKSDVLIQKGIIGLGTKAALIFGVPVPLAQKAKRAFEKEEIPVGPIHRSSP